MAASYTETPSRYTDPQTRAERKVSLWRYIPMDKSPTVLVTGSAGRIGRAVVAELQARGRPVRGFDRVATPGLTECIVGDITDAVAVRRAVEGVGTVIHLAATPDDDDFLTQLAP